MRRIIVVIMDIAFKLWGGWRARDQWSRKEPPKYGMIGFGVGYRSHWASRDYQDVRCVLLMCHEHIRLRAYVSVVFVQAKKVAILDGVVTSRKDVYRVIGRLSGRTVVKWSVLSKLLIVKGLARI